MAAISVIVATFDEGQLLAECLESVRWADELLVVDVGHQPDIPGICERYGARLFEHEWVPYGGHVRDEAALQSGGEWILALDPDERVTPELATKLGQLAVECAVDAYEIPFRTVLFWSTWASGRGSGAADHTQRNVGCPRGEA